MTLNIIYQSATILKPLRAEVNNIDYLTTVQFSAGKPWNLARIVSSGIQMNFRIQNFPEEH